LHVAGDGSVRARPGVAVRQDHSPIDSERAVAARCPHARPDEAIPVPFGAGRECLLGGTVHCSPCEWVTVLGPALVVLRAPSARNGGLLATVDDATVGCHRVS